MSDVVIGYDMRYDMIFLSRKEQDSKVEGLI